MLFGVEFFWKLFLKQSAMAGPDEQPSTTEAKWDLFLLYIFLQDFQNESELLLIKSVWSRSQIFCLGARWAARTVLHLSNPDVDDLQTPTGCGYWWIYSLIPKVRLTTNPFQHQAWSGEELSRRFSYIEQGNHIPVEGHCSILLPDIDINVGNEVEVEGKIVQQTEAAQYISVCADQSILPISTSV